MFIHWKERETGWSGFIFSPKLVFGVSHTVCPLINLFISTSMGLPDAFDCHIGAQRLLLPPPPPIHTHTFPSHISLDVRIFQPSKSGKKGKGENYWQGKARKLQFARKGENSAWGTKNDVMLCSLQRRLHLWCNNWKLLAHESKECFY